MMTPETGNPLVSLSDEPIATPNIADPVVDTPQYAAAEVRSEATWDIGALPWLPQLPDDWMDEVYERIEAAERTYAAPHLLAAEYGPGTAEYDNEIAAISGSGDYLFTAVHATKSIRRATGRLGFADTGTAGLTAVLAEDNGQGFIMRGRQTGSAAMDETHPIKDAVLPYIESARGFIDVHGCASHLFTDPEYRFNIHAHIGLGFEPDERLVEFGHEIMRFARHELGLYTVIGNEQTYYSQKDDSTELKRNPDGTAYTGNLAGGKPNMMNNYVRRELAARDRTGVPALQIELAGFNRITAADINKKDLRTRVIGVALGWKLLQHVTEMSYTA